MFGGWHGSSFVGTWWGARLAVHLKSISKRSVIFVVSIPKVIYKMFDTTNRVRIRR